jgi:hypothetical protein
VTNPPLGADDTVPAQEVDAERLADHLYRLLAIPRERQEEGSVAQHRRRWTRFPINTPCRVGVYRVAAPREHIWGEAIIRNISQGGAYLSPIHLANSSIPCEPFRLVIQTTEPPLGQLEAHCQVVRLKTNGSVSVGVQFVKLPRVERTRIADLARLPIAQVA